VRLALFGLGRAGQFHLNNISRHRQATLLYVIDEDKTKVDEISLDYNCVGLTSGEQALNDPRVNAVIIATPTKTHYRLIIAAINAGKAVFAEKPVGFTLREIDGAYEAAKKKKIYLYSVDSIVVLIKVGGKLVKQFIQVKLENHKS